MQRVKGRQLEFVFAVNPKGDSQARALDKAKAWLSHIANFKESKNLTTTATDKLLEQVVTSSNLAKALLNVARNKGAAGVDGVSVKEVVEKAKSLLPKLQHMLLNGKYQPGEIRRVWIPKPGGEKRGLGIPNVIDRWVQQAVHQVLEPIIDPTFHDSSHGFRPNRGAHTAIAEAKMYVEAGYKIVVDIDLSKFFDRVNHQRLLNRLALHVKDGRVLKLIHQMLKAKVVLPDGTKVNVEEGTPQGGNLSPLLSNIVLDELDWELARRGLCFVRYADDCNIYVKSKRSGIRVMDSTQKFIEKRLRLKINKEKSRVITFNSYQSSFLGFRISKSKDGEFQINPSEKSKRKVRDKIKELTPRVWGQSLKACIEKLNSYLQGWEAYFDVCNGFSNTKHFFKQTDAHVRRRLRAIIIKQKKRKRHLFRHLIQRGVYRDIAAQTAFSSKGYWRKSNMKGINLAYRNRWFSDRLVSVWKLWARRHIVFEKVQGDSQLLLSF